MTAVTWGELHAGDSVRGADQRAWTVVERRTGLRWQLAGATDWYVLGLGERRVTICRRLADVAPLVARADHAVTAAAVQPFIEAGLPITLEEERLTDQTDQFAAPAAAEPIVDRWNRYLLPDPVTGERRAWTRATTISRTIADMWNLHKWDERMTAKGLALRPDLVAAASALDVTNDRDKLNEIVEQAKVVAGAKSGANMGTAVHALAARVARGEKLELAGEMAEAVTAYRAVIRAAGLEVMASERIVCLPELGIAGTLDAVVSLPAELAKGRPSLAIMDIKTGKDLDYSWLEISIQLAIYARATHVWNPAAKVWAEVAEIDQMRALVAHLPLGGTGQLYAVDIAKGWANVELALAVRAARSGARSLSWLVKPADPAAVALRNVAAAGTRAELATLWDSLHKRGLWTEAIGQAAFARLAELERLVAVA